MMNDEKEFNLLNFSADRVLIDMIEDARAKGGDQAILLLILDQNTIKILSSFLKMTDVIGLGIVAVEKLELIRQKLPSYQAIYFVTPTKESVDHIVKDFSNDISPSYSRLHIFFSSKCPQSLLESLVTPSIIRRIKTLKEFNLAYLMKDSNLFELGMKDSLNLFYLKDNTTLIDRFTDEIAERLLTVLATLKDKPFLQFQKNSMLAGKVAKSLGAKMEKYFSQKVSKDQRGIFVILDRTIDKSTPFLYDYSYSCIINDLLSNLIVGSTLIMNKDGKEFKHELNGDDYLWIKYKFEHISPSVASMQDELNSFLKSDQAKGMQSNMETVGEMSRAIRGIKSYKQRSEEFSSHLYIAEEFQKLSNSVKISDLIDLQQELITGIDESLNRAKGKDTLKKLGVLLPNLNEEQAARLVALIPINMEMSENNLRIIIDNKLNERQMAGINNLKYLGISMTGSTLHSEKEHMIDAAKLNSLKEKKKNYREVKSSPVVTRVASSCIDLKLGSDFESIEDIDKQQFKSKKNLEEDEKPNIIIFMIGDLVTSEVASFERLSKETKSFKLMLGATSIGTASQFLSKLSMMNSNINENSSSKFDS